MIESMLGLLDGVKFQSDLDTVMKEVRHNGFVIAKRYNDLMDVARKDFEVAEKNLIAKIVTTVYEESKKVKKTYLESERMNHKELSNSFCFPIEKWKELKTYGDFLNLNKYGISFERKLNETLKKYHLDDMIRAYFDCPYYDKGAMYSVCKVADAQEIEESNK